MPVGDRGEDVPHGVFVEGVDADDVEVSEEALRDVVASAARGAHGGQHHDAFQLKHARVLPTVTHRF